MDTLKSRSKFFVQGSEGNIEGCLSNPAFGFRTPHRQCRRVWVISDLIGMVDAVHIGHTLRK